MIDKFVNKKGSLGVVPFKVKLMIVGGVEPIFKPGPVLH
jgi:hypothetical protein